MGANLPRNAYNVRNGSIGKTHCRQALECRNLENCVPCRHQTCQQRYNSGLTEHFLIVCILTYRHQNICHTRLTLHRILCIRQSCQRTDYFRKINDSFHSLLSTTVAVNYQLSRPGWPHSC